jgi:hypothetical protein
MDIGSCPKYRQELATYQDARRAGAVYVDTLAMAPEEGRARRGLCAWHLGNELRVCVGAWCMCLGKGRGARGGSIWPVHHVRISDERVCRASSLADRRW